MARRLGAGFGGHLGQCAFTASSVGTRCERPKLARIWRCLCPARPGWTGRGTAGPASPGATMASSKAGCRERPAGSTASTFKFATGSGSRHALLAAVLAALVTSRAGSCQWESQCRPPIAADCQHYENGRGTAEPRRVFYHDVVAREAFWVCANAVTLPCSTLPPPLQ